VVEHGCNPYTTAFPLQTGASSSATLSARRLEKSGKAAARFFRNDIDPQRLAAAANGNLTAFDACDIDLGELGHRLRKDQRAVEFLGNTFEAAGDRKVAPKPLRDLPMIRFGASPRLNSSRLAKTGSKRRLSTGLLTRRSRDGPRAAARPDPATL